LERIYRAAGTFIEYNLLYFIFAIFIYLFIYLFIFCFLSPNLSRRFVCVFLSLSLSLLLSSFYLVGKGGIGGRRNSRSGGRRGRPLSPPLAAPPNRIKRSTSYTIRMPLNRCRVLLLRIFLQRSRRHVHFTLYSRADLDIPFFSCYFFSPFVLLTPIGTIICYFSCISFLRVCTTRYTQERTLLASDRIYLYKKARREREKTLFVLTSRNTSSKHLPIPQFPQLFFLNLILNFLSVC
jgi:hypothetical protein